MVAVLRRIISPLILPAIIVGSICGLYVYRTHHNVEAQLQAQKDRNAELQLIVERLSTERRVADLLVTDQTPDASGQLRTTLLFVEYDRHGEALPARRFVIDGQVVHIDALVVKFDGRYVQQNDSLRGHSVALFTRIYGETQSPQSAAQIDEPGKIPPAYRGTDARASSFENQLWSDFWRLADDDAYRQSMGVRVAQGEGVWRPFEPGYLYHIALENNGGLNITSEKVPGIFTDLLPQKLPPK
jgi:hypothetical protein